MTNCFIFRGFHRLQMEYFDNKHEHANQDKNISIDKLKHWSLFDDNHADVIDYYIMENQIDLNIKIWFLIWHRDATNPNPLADLGTSIFSQFCILFYSMLTCRKFTKMKYMNIYWKIISVNWIRNKHVKQVVWQKLYHFTSYSSNFRLFYWSWNRRILYTTYDSIISYLIHKNLLIYSKNSSMNKKNQSYLWECIFRSNTQPNNLFVFEKTRRNFSKRKAEACMYI